METVTRHDDVRGSTLRRKSWHGPAAGAVQHSRMTGRLNRAGARRSVSQSSDVDCGAYPFCALPIGSPERRDAGICGWLAALIKRCSRLRGSCSFERGVNAPLRAIIPRGIRLEGASRQTAKVLFSRRFRPSSRGLSGGGRIPGDFLDHTLGGNTGVLSESIAQTETIDWDKVGDSSGRSTGRRVGNWRTGQ